MIKISPSGWAAIAACSCVLSWSIGTKTSARVDCNLTTSQVTEFKKLASNKANLEKFENKLGKGCKLGKITYWNSQNKILSAQFQSKNKKIVKVRYVIKKRHSKT